MVDGDEPARHLAALPLRDAVPVSALAAIAEALLQVGGEGVELVLAPVAADGRHLPLPFLSSVVRVASLWIVGRVGDLRPHEPLPGETVALGAGAGPLLLAERVLGGAARLLRLALRHPLLELRRGAVPGRTSASRRAGHRRAVRSGPRRSRASLAVNHVWLIRPGIAAIWPPRAGIHHEWMTSQSGAVTVRCTGSPAGTRSRSIATAPFGYVYCQENCCPVTFTSRRPAAALALGTFVMLGSLTKTNAATATRMTTGIVVHISSSFDEPWICGPSVLACPLAPAVLDDERDEQPFDPDEHEEHEAGDEPVRVGDAVRVRRLGRDRGETAVPRQHRRGREERSEEGADDDKGQLPHGRMHSMNVADQVRRRTIVRLPGNVTRPFEVFLNGVLQAEGVDYEVMGGVLLFEADLRSEGKLGFWRWAAIFIGMVGTYRQNDSVDIAFAVNGRRVVATKLPLEPAE